MEDMQTNRMKINCIGKYSSYVDEWWSEQLSHYQWILHSIAESRVGYIFIMLTRRIGIIARVKAPSKWVVTCNIVDIYNFLIWVQCCWNVFGWFKVSRDCWNTQIQMDKTCKRLFFSFKKKLSDLLGKYTNRINGLLLWSVKEAEVRFENGGEEVGGDYLQIRKE